MSILDDLLEVGIGFISDPEAIRDLLDAAMRLCDQDRPTLARSGLKFAYERAEDIAHLAPEVIVGLTGKRAVFGDIAAREEYLRDFATAEEILEAQERAHRETVEEATHSTWTDTVLPILKALGPALPFLLAVL